jgi:protein-S-isoprenylcysteine O-methyltransferase Ste14
MRGLLILTLATLLYSGFHSLMASNEVKLLVHRRFGPGTDRWYRLVYNLLAGITFIPVLWLLVVLPDRTLYTVEIPWLLFMVAGQIGGAAIIVVGLIQTGLFSFLGISQLFSREQIGHNAIFVTRGLYRWVRHPLYTGGLIIIWLTPILTINSLTLIILLTLYLVVGAKLEEKRLVAEFGQAYQDYQRNVPMLIPGLLGRRGGN